MDDPPSPVEQAESESDLDLAPKPESNEISLQFRLGTRRVSAEGTVCEHHRNVVHLRVLPSWVDRFVWLLGFLPAPLRGLLQSRWPEWFLPPRIVLKRQKEGWDEEFENEKAVYQRLAPLPGTVIPNYYGEVECPATAYTAGRALVLSDVGGIGLYEDAASGLDTEHVENMLLESLRPLASLGVAHDDSKLDNYRLVGDRIMVIDFDSSYILEDGDPEYHARSDARFTTEQYWLVHGGKRPSLLL
ncbi:Protein kinase domain-containing protein [Madurella fahalii]|uniref:Protein kinase domain-containing protein n=1 Tax=Madurella fahalii TaxID=1157608 RepID=A0ABQ0G8D1_9PEZI